MKNLVYVQILVLFIYLLVMIFYFMKIAKSKSVRIASFNSVILFSLVTVLVYASYVMLTPPVLSLKGNEMVTVNVFDDYIDEGYQLVYPGKSLKVSIENHVDSNKIGVYDVKYSINYHNKKVAVTRKVQVVDDEKPTIKLNGANEVTIVQGTKYKEAGYVAEDNYDGDITNKVKVTDNIKDELGSYEVIYTVKDSSGNTYSTKRIVNRIIANNGVIYLTFDDGPSSTTPKILDILKKENIKATFFIVNYSSGYEDIIKRIVKEGHTIALHSYTHNYKLIYSSEEAYFDDLLKLKAKVKETTGIDTNIIRFPGGSSNTISMFNEGIMTRLVKEVKDKGFHYFDWNVDCGDAGGARTSIDVYNNVMNNLSIKRSNVVLMHDFGNNNKTLNALESIIEDSKAKGYSFSKITYDTPMVVHSVSN